MGKRRKERVVVHQFGAGGPTVVRRFGGNDDHHVAGVHTIREGVTFEFGAFKENSPISDLIGYWWGIRGSDGWIWRNRWVKENDGRFLSHDQVAKMAVENTRRFLVAVSDKIAAEVLGEGKE